METDLESTLVEEDVVLQMDKSDQGETAETTEAPNKLVVDIKGAVTNPGVYELDNGNRVVDLIDIAGGFITEALDTEINLAQKLTDEMVIYVPKEGEETEVMGETMTSINSNETDPNKVKINDASEEELTTLNGVGPSKAQSIITYREEHGPFEHVDDLLEISGIGEKTLEQFKEAIIVP